MTVEGQAAAEGGTKLKDFLTEKLVTKVLFIDDGFYRLEHMEPTSDEQIALWTAVLGDDEAQQVISDEGVVDSTDLSGDKVSGFLKRPEGDPLRRLAEESDYVESYKGKTRQIQFVMKYLDSLGVEVERCDPDNWEAKLHGASIVFLDWQLESAGDGSRAKKIAMEIHRQGGAVRPMIVLISSYSEIKEKAREFSQESGLISGLFDAMPKEWLSDEPKIDLQMTILCAHLEKGYVVQNFVEAISSRTKDAADAFVNKIRNLTLSDYANLQSLALKEEGHPLGDYLTQLLAGVWIDTLFQGELREPLKSLDKEDFETLPALVEPSDVLYDLYNAAIFDTHIGEFKPHPHADEPRADQGVRLAPSLGDIVVEQEGEKASKVYMVINPQCDLAESPRHTRRIDDDLSLLLVPGDLCPVGMSERSQPKETANTPCFMVDGAKVRIHWHGKKQVAIPYSKFSEWLAEKPRDRRARMRTSFALSLQTAVRSELARIGLPVPPPMYERIELKVRYASAGNWTGDAAPQRLGRLLMARNAKFDRLVLPHEFLTGLCCKIQEGIAVLADSPKSGDAEKAAEIRQALSNPYELQRLAMPFQLRGKNETFLAGAVLVCRESNAPVSNLDRRLVICLMMPDGENP